MTEKEVRKLNRHDLLILLAEQTERGNKLEEKLKKEEEELKQLRITKELLRTKEIEVEQLRAAVKKLEEQNIEVEECGSMAEAALQLNNIFKSADLAAAQYISSAKQMSERQIAECKERETESMMKCTAMVYQAEEKAAQVLRQAEEKAALEIAKIDKYWDEVRERVRKMETDYIWLRGIINEKNQEYEEKI